MYDTQFIFQEQRVIDKLNRIEGCEVLVELNNMILKYSLGGWKSDLIPLEEKKIKGKVPDLRNQLKKFYNEVGGMNGPPINKLNKKEIINCISKYNMLL